MSYKIAVASTDGIRIDTSFQQAEQFVIYRISEDRSYAVDEIRTFHVANETAPEEQKECPSASACGDGRKCGSGTGCGGEDSPKLKLIEDCRSLICVKTGFGIQKKLERKAITAFEIECDIEKALKKIVDYYYKVDHHQSLRGIARQNNQ